MNGHPWAWLLLAAFVVGHFGLLGLVLRACGECRRCGGTGWMMRTVGAVPFVCQLRMRCTRCEGRGYRGWP